MEKRIIVYGDIHGCLEEFEALRAQIKPTKDDIEMTVGDFLNKGPHSLKTLRYLLHHKIDSVMGNNEAKIIKLYTKYQKKGEDFLETLRDFDKKTLLQMKEEDIKYLKSLPYFLKIENLTLLHGGLPYGTSLHDNMGDKEKKLLTQLRFYNKDGKVIPYEDIEGRDKFWSEVYEGEEGFIVFGHHPFEKVKIEEHAIGIDTGCVYGGTLTAISFPYHDKKVEIENYTLYSIKAVKNHFNTI